ncbi:MAG: hypothetical protein AAGD10_06280 [Myxococcota bacterium]
MSNLSLNACDSELAPSFLSPVTVKSESEPGRLRGGHQGLVTGVTRELNTPLGALVSSARSIHEATL